MAVDLTSVPWNRLARLAPPGAEQADLQDAADRYALRADVYAAAADLWEEKALGVDVTTQATSTEDEARAVQSVTQDGISVTYASDPLAGNGLSARVAMRGQMLATARRLRARAKTSSPLVHRPTYDAWTGHDVEEIENIIVVDEV